jgi:heptosyltransferase III
MTEFHDIKNILVIKLRHIGDVLLTVPVFRALRENFPGARISALVNAGTEEVLSGNPLIDDIIKFDRRIKTKSAPKKYAAELAFLSDIRARGFDMAVDLTSGDRAAILSYVSGARYRIAYDPRGEGFPGKRFFYTHLAKKNGSLHMVLQNLDVLAQFGIRTQNQKVDFFIPGEAQEFAEKLFKEHEVSASDTVVHIHPTSRWLFKCWRDEYMAEIIDWLLDHNVRVIVTSAPMAREMKRTNNTLDHVRKRSQVIDLCGKTTLKQLAAVCSRSGLFIGVDSAPMHIAAAVGTPIIALFGPSGADQWGPWIEDRLVLVKDMGCVICQKCKREGVEVRRCLDAIRPEEVIAGIRQKLKLRDAR